mmetsp:Transcript_100759/g.260347  ORF Transcript_100759/g.260347 Transcript_100759/m.260347 type:complete len:851 (-) Transcript_100759:132-2684(-)
MAASRQPRAEDVQSPLAQSLLQPSYDPQLRVGAAEARSPEEKSEMLGDLASWVLNRRGTIILAALFSTIVSLLGAIHVLDVTNLEFRPVPGMASYEANNHFEAVFPGIARGSTFAGILEVAFPGRVLEVPGIAAFTASLREELNATGQLLTFASGASPGLEGAIGLGRQLLSPNGRAVLFQWTIADSPTSNVAREFGRKSTRLFAKGAQLPGISFQGVAGMPLTTEASIEAGEHDLLRMDSCSLPLALGVLWLVVRSYRLLLLPVACMVCAASLSFGFLFVLGHYKAVMVTTPSLMMSVLIAMSFDYSLFLLTRFKEELEHVDRETGFLNSPERVEEAIIRTMRTAGFMIQLSSQVLFLAFAILMFVPSDLICSLGEGCAAALFFTILTHLLLLPSLLLEFEQYLVPRPGLDRRPPGASEPGGDAAAGEARRREWPLSWAKLAQVTTTYPGNVVITVAVISSALAIGAPLLRVRGTAAIQIDIPRGSAIEEAFSKIAGNFGAGVSLPYQIMLEAPGNSSVLSREFWQASEGIASSLAAAVRDLDRSRVTLPNDVDGLQVPFDLVEGCLRTGRSPVCENVLNGLETFVNPSHTAARGFICSSLDPVGVDGRVYVQRLREAAAQLQNSTGIRITIAGVAGDITDLVTQVYHMMPLIISMTMGMVLVAVGIAYKSVLIPLRSVVSIGLTLLTVYGLAVRTWQDGEMEWTHIANFTGKFNAVPWAPPVVCFTIVVGICLDYDIFLLTRANEFRSAGMDATSSIQAALCSTGSVITAAGVIMSIAFGGLLFSASLEVGGISFFVVFAVLYDTFIVRCLFTPASMSLLGTLNWWPGPLSEETVAVRGQALKDALLP